MCGGVAVCAKHLKHAELTVARVHGIWVWNSMNFASLVLGFVFFPISHLEGICCTVYSALRYVCFLCTLFACAQTDASGRQLYAYFIIHKFFGIKKYEYSANDSAQSSRMQKNEIKKTKKTAGGLKLSSSHHPPPTRELPRWPCAARWYAYPGDTLISSNSRSALSLSAQSSHVQLSSARKRSQRRKVCNVFSAFFLLYVIRFDSLKLPLPLHKFGSLCEKFYCLTLSFCCCFIVVIVFVVVCCCELSWRQTNEQQCWDKRTTHSRRRWIRRTYVLCMIQ